MGKDILTGWKLGMIMGVILFLIAFNIAFISGGESKNVEYELRITFEPFCQPETCVNVTNSTNTTCSTNCYGIFKVEGINDNSLFFEIDTSSTKWIDGNTESRFGYKTIDLGNLSDISGIREELKNCTWGWESLLRCQNTVRDLDVNLTSCVLLSGYSTNYTLDKCETEKNSIQTQLNSRAGEISTKVEEIESMKNDKWIWGVGGILVGFLFLKQGLPYLKGRNTPKDPGEEGFAANTGY